jgi:hypothetical protein
MTGSRQAMPESGRQGIEDRGHAPTRPSYRSTDMSPMAHDGTGAATPQASFCSFVLM